MEKWEITIFHRKINQLNGLKNSKLVKKAREEPHRIIVAGRFNDGV